MNAYESSKIVQDNLPKNKDFINHLAEIAYNFCLIKCSDQSSLDVEIYITFNTSSYTFTSFEEFKDSFSLTDQVDYFDATFRFDKISIHLKVPCADEIHLKCRSQNNMNNQNLLSVLEKELRLYCETFLPNASSEPDNQTLEIIVKQENSLSKYLTLKNALISILVAIIAGLILRYIP